MVSLAFFPSKIVRGYSLAFLNQNPKGLALVFLSVNPKGGGKGEGGLVRGLASKLVKK